jgi:leader peptidase (prepilin peptidase)/N-methyltransferase
VGAIGAVVWCALLSYYDIRFRRLPNWLTLPGAAVILLVAAASGRGVPALAGAAALFGVYLVVHLVAAAAMGAGDVKLALGIGALTGAFGVEVWTLAALGAAAASGLWAVVVAARRGDGAVPHGPAMCGAAVLALGAAGIS